MIATRADSSPAAASTGINGLTGPVGLGLALAAVVGARWAATVAGVSPYLVGALFGAAFLAIAWTGGMRLARVGVGPIVIGIAGSIVLVGLAFGAIQLAGQPIRAVPKSDFAIWALITIVVASAEELVLRGALFNSLRDSAGLLVAVIVTSAAFALMHVPLYGWHVVPLDLGVGVFLAGLRLASGSVAATAIAHTVADLATWWL